ncbi:ABC transporter permease subunit [Marinobacterium aestuariivivens]|uniref:ABC transporter permease subunit n=1 Tax=Marinobacterium aestuariivivens TaxID=1698799 RepID=A0ABW2A0S2_9GAMM
MNTLSESVPLTPGRLRLSLVWLQGRLRGGQALVASVPTLWLGLFFLIPFLVVFKISLAETAIAVPPYSALLDWDGAMANLQVNFGNYQFLFEDSLYLDAYLNSIKVAGISTLIALVIAYPMAYVIARASPGRRLVLLSLVILPFWTSFLLRVYAWMGFLKKNGVINDLLMSLGLIDQPLTMLQTDFAVYIGIIYTYLPFMILPLYSALEKLDDSLLEAAEDLGCRPLQRFWLVTVPLSLPGIVAGCLLVFIPAVGEFVIPALLGGSDTLMIGRVLWDEFFLNRDWPMASAVAILMLLFLVVPIMLFRNAQGRKEAA